MSPASKNVAAGLVAGAVVGVLGVLLTLFALVDKLDARYLPRAEALVRLDAIQASVTRIDNAMTRHIEAAGKP